MRELVPLNSGWFAQAEIAAMDITANRPAPNARRFEAGTPPVVNCYAAEAGLKMLLRVGTPAVEKRVFALTRRCMESLAGDRLAERDAARGRSGGARLWRCRRAIARVSARSS